MKRQLYILIFSLLGILFGGVCAHAEFDESTVIAVVKPRTESVFSLSAFDAPFGELEIEETENLDADAESVFSLYSAAAEPQTYKLTLAEKGTDKVLEAVEYLNTLDNIEYAGPNYIYKISAVPNDPYYSSQYALEKVGAPQVWDMNIDCSGIVVAVIDTGVAINHPDLADNIWTNPNEKEKTTFLGRDNDGNGYKNDLHGWDFVDSDNDPYDANGHGTHVAGIVSAVTNNGTGVASIARNAKIVPIRVMDSSGKGTTSTIYKGIKYVRKMGFGIVNCSFGSEESDTLTKNAIKKTNAIFVCAAGNDSANNDTTAIYPANYTSSNIISVASTDSADALSSFSNYGAKTVDIAAPGSSIRSTYYSGGSLIYAYMNGTSMACPMVTSTIAAMKAKYPKMTNTEIIERLKSTADPVSALAGKTITGARLNAYEALSTHAASVTLSSGEVTLEIGETAELIAAALPSDTTDIPVWTSSDADVAIVENGTVTAIGEGTAEIIVRYGSVSAACEVTVLPPPQPVFPASIESGRIEFENNSDGSITAELIFVEPVTIMTEDMRLYVVYRDKITRELKDIEIKEITESMTADFAIPEDLSECDITMYVWDSEMKPLMKAQEYNGNN